MSSWFEIDKEGLSRIMDRRDGKAFVLAELIQNAWDAPGTSRVLVDLTPVPGRPVARLRVEDDSPDGFKDLRHSFTLFAPSQKRGDPSTRGRFNFGEKLVLSLCSSATISTTSGTVAFTSDGRKRLPARRERGSVFEAEIRMTREEITQAIDAATSFLPPEGIETVVNGVRLNGREPLATFVAPLPTEIANDDGPLRRTVRRTTIRLYRPLAGVAARVYEMGIPVAETGDTFDVDVAQKIPLSLERDAVSAAWLSKMRVAVAGVAHDLLTEDETASPWVGQALGSPDLPAEAVASILERRFGPKVVSYDLSDREANDRATAAGYTVLKGGTLTAEQWASVRRAGTILPSGRVTPAPRPFSKDGPAAEDAELTGGMTDFASLCRRLAQHLMGCSIEVRFLKSFNATAAYGGRTIYFNVGRLGRKWFEGPLRPDQIDLIIHEFGHEYEANHLSARYLDALTRLGGRATMLALQDPSVFAREAGMAA